MAIVWSDSNVQVYIYMYVRNSWKKLKSNEAELKKTLLLLNLGKQKKTFLFSFLLHTFSAQLTR